MYNLIKYIEEKGIKQGKVAQAMDITPDYWYKSRRKGLCNISVEKINKLAQFLNMEPAEVFRHCQGYYEAFAESKPQSTRKKAAK